MDNIGDKGERCSLNSTRRLYATVTNDDFGAFVSKSRKDYEPLSDGRADIEAALTDLVRAYAEGRVVILTNKEINDAKKAIAASHLVTGK